MKLLLAALAIAVGTGGALAQEAAPWAADAGNDYWIQPDVTYNVENNYQNKLDVIYPHKATAPVPTVISFTAAAGYSDRKRVLSFTRSRTFRWDGRR